MNAKTISMREKISRLRAKFMVQLPGRIAEARVLLENLKAMPYDQATAVDLHRFFHSLKGTGKSFGFEDIGSAAAQGEDIAIRLLDQPNAHLPPHWQELLEICLDGIEGDVAATQISNGIEENALPEGLVPVIVNAVSSQAESARLVYLCDDEVDQVELLGAQLACFGFEIVTFVDTESLRRAVLTRMPDAVVVDIHFPQGHSAGTEALLALKAEIGRNVPAIFISGRDDFSARLQAVQAGGSGYFHKPVQALELVSALDELTQYRTPAPFRILIVDDEAEIAGYHSLILEEAGMVTCQVTEPDQVLELLLNFRPDMVLMDMYMPSCNGRDLAQVIRQVPEHIGLPIVYLSSETDRLKQFSAMRVGAEGFLTKPVEPAELVAAVAIRAERMRTLRNLMARDSLTGLFNHTATTQLLDNAIVIARRQGTSLCFAMIDIDLFKSVNDTYGHPVGDRVILALTRVLQQRLRASDIVGRYGGEEFAVILNDVDIVKSKALINEIREDFSRIRFQDGERQFSSTFSAGVASFPQYPRLEQLREAADKALYQAKHHGRNCVFSASTNQEPA